MKKAIFGAVLSLFITGYSFAQETVIPENQLPVAVKTNIVKHFEKKNITKIVKDVENGRVVYDVLLEDGTEAEFTKSGELREAKNSNGLSKTVVPAKIQAYLKKNYPNAIITKWDKSSHKQEIELNNDLDLVFSSKGDFIRIDD